MPQLNICRIRTSIDGRPVRSFDDFVQSREQRQVQNYGPFRAPDFTSQLYVTVGPPLPPKWANFLNEGFPDATFGASRAVEALLAIEVTRRNQKHFYAILFGYGRFLLRRGAVERGYGLRSALNIIYEGDDGSADYDVTRLRGVEKKRVRENTIRSRHQANRSTDLESFEFDLRSDLLYRVDGPPRNTDNWGNRVGGADSFNLNRALPFESIGRICRDLEAAHSSNDYTKRFQWIDNIRPLEETDELVGEIVELVRAGDPAIELVVPQMLEWDRLDGFQFPSDRRRRGSSPLRGRPDLRVTTRPDVRLNEYLHTLGDAVATLDAERLKKEEVYAINAEGQREYHWPVWDCLAGEFALDGEVFVIDEGSIYHVSTDFISELDDAIEQVEAWEGTVPPPPRSLHEKDVNKAIAQQSSDYLFMDAKLARSARGVTPVEICDVFCADGTLLHVKKGWGASKVSHLFNQGATSAELLKMDPRFREDALGKVADAENIAARETGDATYLGKFQAALGDNGVLGRRRVVFGIIDEWRGRGLTDALPFFAKVFLRDTLYRLKRLDFKVAYSPISYAD